MLLNAAVVPSDSVYTTVNINKEIMFDKHKMQISLFHDVWLNNKFFLSLLNLNIQIAVLSQTQYSWSQGDIKPWVEITVGIQFLIIVTGRGNFSDSREFLFRFGIFFCSWQSHCDCIIYLEIVFEFGLYSQRILNCIVGWLIYNHPSIQFNILQFNWKLRF